MESIIICDAPMVEADFEEIVSRNGLKEMVEILNDRGYKIILEDIRARKTSKINNVVVDEIIDPEKAKNAVIVDLKEMSFLDEEVVKQNKLSYGSYRRNQISKESSKRETFISHIKTDSWMPMWSFRFQS